MGVRFARDYYTIIDELAEILGQITDANEFFNMDIDTWLDISGQEKQELLKTMADDIFFALGREASVAITVGQCLFEYDNNRHIIKVTDGLKISLINLI